MSHCEKHPHECEDCIRERVDELEKKKKEIEDQINDELKKIKYPPVSIPTVWIPQKQFWYCCPCKDPANLNKPMCYYCTCYCHQTVTFTTTTTSC